MRTIERARRFRKDYRRETSGQSAAHVNKLDIELEAVVTALAADEPLAARFQDHALVGEWQDCRDCHIRNDLVLIYRKPDDDTLELVRLGSHSELGLA